MIVMSVFVAVCALAAALKYNLCQHLLKVAQSLRERPSSNSDTFAML